MASISIFDAISTCDYRQDTHDIIISTFFDTFSNLKSEIYKTNKFCKSTNKKENIFMVKAYLSVNLKEKIYEVQILVYFFSNFPKFSPEIYIMNVENILVNPKCLIVNKNNLQIVSNSIQNWSINSNVKDVLTEIQKYFSSVFPIYQGNSQNINYGELCCLNTQNLIQVNFNDNNGNNTRIIPKSINNTGNKPLINFDSETFHQNTYSKSNQSNNQINNNSFKNSFKNSNDTFSDEKLKHAYIMDILPFIFNKFKNKIAALKTQHNLLISYKNKFLDKIEKSKKLTDKKDDVINSISSLSGDLMEKIKTIKLYIVINNDQDLRDKMDSYIKIDNEKILELVAIEAVLEDFLLIIKKAFERKIFDFNETLKLTRKITKEIFTIKHIREKKLFNK